MFLHRRHLGFRSFSRKHGCISMGALEGSSDTNSRQLSPPYSFQKREPRTRSGSHVIITLDPKKFAEKKQQCLHIGNLLSFTPLILLHKKSNPGSPARIVYDRPKGSATGIGYPPNTKAFLYYSVSPGKPPIAGEIRLRVTTSDDPASFESGSDLLLTNGQPWSRPLYALSKYHVDLYEKLREERLVPDDLDTILSTLPSEKVFYRRSNLLYTLNDTFILNFSNKESVCTVITEQGMERIRFYRQIYDNRSTERGPPYTGNALVRFERSTLPDHKGTRTVVLRFLKIITPVKCVIPLYDGHVCCPKEGELHRRVPSEWSINIDKPKGAVGASMIRGLRLLWDT